MSRADEVFGNRSVATDTSANADLRRFVAGGGCGGHRDGARRHRVHRPVVVEGDVWDRLAALTEALLREPRGLAGIDALAGVFTDCPVVVLSGAVIR